MLPIFSGYGDSYHPSSNWADSLSKKINEWHIKSLTSKSKLQIETWTKVECIYGLMHLNGNVATRAQIIEWIDSNKKENNNLKNIALCILKTFEAVKIQAYEQALNPLNQAELIEFYKLIIGNPNISKAEIYRINEGTSQIPTHKPASPESLPLLLEMALDWFTTDSFAELHPVEQASLFHLRLLDLQPFAMHNNLFTLLLTNFYLFRANLPPLILLPDDNEKYKEVIGYGFQMITQPSLELFSQALIRTIDQWNNMSSIH